MEIFNVDPTAPKKNPQWYAYPEAQKDFIRHPRHAIESAIVSVDDDIAAQEFDDYAFVASLIFEASRLHIDIPGRFVNAFPGDHYRLLAALIKLTQPQLMIDIGTFTGLSARVMGQYSHKGSSVVTFDVTPYDEFPDSVLYPGVCKDFDIKQKIEDLSDPVVFSNNLDLIKSADFIMCDGPKDNRFEPIFLRQLSQVSMPCKRRWLLLDDIRFMDMIGLWRAIQSPKIDLTSFGHFSGTGLVDISKGLILKA